MADGGNRMLPSSSLVLAFARDGFMCAPIVGAAVLGSEPTLPFPNAFTPNTTTELRLQAGVKVTE